MREAGIRVDVSVDIALLSHPDKLQECLREVINLIEYEVLMRMQAPEPYLVEIAVPPESGNEVRVDIDPEFPDTLYPEPG